MYICIYTHSYGCSLPSSSQVRGIGCSYAGGGLVLKGFRHATRRPSCRRAYVSHGGGPFITVFFSSAGFVFLPSSPLPPRETCNSHGDDPLRRTAAETARRVLGRRSQQCVRRAFKMFRYRFVRCTFIFSTLSKRTCARVDTNRNGF